ncbi:MurR/RpiR family transcriptional regulator [Alkaliphilus hydrothermalis]|uniref:DNA-binding MurR/RpiR family transcriptional regulator n=1 Tax=Alkaliphilus hydrothermalis TaxID=1482730 RepID=A0ABS2NMB2_9FIRM|nr:MurR/RpiR family transcriptional regulator [Alkaliphilus hydrothermalis]MBM7614093.1 DNA-binding MurR/RpiR family transcriptional regulator [Alkaliphilus hydrothermalis]
MIDEKKDLILQIQKNFSKLSKGQKLIAQFIIDNYDKAAFMTASKLGLKVGVSESTVVRFANALGFEGYPELQKALQEIIKTKLTTVQRVEMASEFSNEGAILKKVLKSDMENIRNTLENIDPKDFQAVVDQIFSANRIYIVGLRSSTALAEYLGFYLNLILDNVKIVGYGISDIFEQMLRISKDDLVIGISFPRYSNRTIEVLNYAKEEGVPIISITDSLLSPVAGLSDYCLTGKSNMVSFVDSLVAPLSLINALIVAVGMREKEEIRECFNKLENIWEKYNIYDNKNQS